MDLFSLFQLSKLWYKEGVDLEIEIKLTIVDKLANCKATAIAIAKVDLFYLLFKFLFVFLFSNSLKDIRIIKINKYTSFYLSDHKNFNARVIASMSVVVNFLFNTSLAVFNFLLTKIIMWE